MYILFTDCLYYLPVHCHSCCFYIQLHGGIREITSMPVYIFCFILCFILLTRRRSIRLLYTTFVIAIQRRFRFESVTFCCFYTSVFSSSLSIFFHLQPNLIHFFKPHLFFKFSLKLCFLFFI